jgi:hypothetical protein
MIRKYIIGSAHKNHLFWLQVLLNCHFKLCIWSFASYIILRSGSWNFNFADTSWYIHNRKVNFKIEFHSFYFLWIFSPHVPCRFIVLWNLKWQFRSTWSQNKWFLWALPIIYFLIIVFISPLAEWWVYWNTLVRPSLNLVYVTSHSFLLCIYHDVSAKLKFQLPDLKIIYEAKDQIHVELIQILILINILFFKVCFSVHITIIISRQN